MLGARVQLKGWQQAAVAFGSAFGALLDPRRADLIAALGETTGKPAFERVLQRMNSSAEGRVNPYCPFFVRSFPTPFGSKFLVVLDNSIFCKSCAELLTSSTHFFSHLKCELSLR